MNEGWIKLHRKIKNSWIYQDPEYLKAWITILLEINHEPGKVLIKGTLFEYKAGESLNSLETWGQLFGRWSKGRVRRFFQMLINDQMIDTVSETITTRLSVCNWETYQKQRNTDETQTDPQTERTRNADGPQTRSIKNEKNIKNIVPDHLKEIWPEFLKMRKLIKKQATERAQKNIIKKLDNFSKDPSIQIKIVEQSINNSWQDVYELKNSRNNYQPPDKWAGKQL